jgi:hypothetical protein
VDLLEIHVEVGQHRGGHTFTLADEPEQQVLGPDVIVLQANGFLASHREDLPHPVGEVVVHPWSAI